MGPYRRPNVHLPAPSRRTRELSSKLMGHGGLNVLVIVPTHDHHATLDLAVSSALRQELPRDCRLSVTIIGDGVDEATRDVAVDICRRHAQVNFLDQPASASRNERTRHEVITSTAADVVTYLGDDDLFLPHHVATIIELLIDHDFVHPFPVFVDRNGIPVAHPIDLQEPHWVTWHLQPGHNTIGLTGASHTTSFYRSLPHGWQEPPPDRWSDHFFWCQIFGIPGVRLCTSSLSTVIKQPASWTPELTPVERRRSLLLWHERLGEPGFAHEWNQLVDDATRRAAVSFHYWTSVHHETIDQLRHAATLDEQTISTLRDELRATS